MKKIKLKNVVIFVLAIIGVVGIPLGFNSVFNKPTVFNKIVASKLYKEPANKTFVDQNFYNCIVDEYNSKNNTKLPYTTSLTDEQLKTITNLSCDNKEITDVSGLEKLTSLTNLHLIGNNIINIDLNSNKELIDLRLDVNEISSIDISNNTKLTYLDLSYNNITNIDLSQNTSLTKLGLRSNNISTIDISNNTKLTYLLLDYNDIENINLSQNTSLETLWLSTNKIRNIDLSQNTLLTSLNLESNKISSIVLSQNTSLTSLNLESNKISSIDLSQNTSLKTLYLSDNNISNIDLSKNTSLKGLELTDNRLSSIYLNDTISLDKITDMIGTQKTKQTYISFGNNKIISPKEPYLHYFNTKILIPNKVSIVELGDGLGIKNLTFKIYDGEKEVTEGNIKDGYIFKLYDGEILIETNLIKLMPNNTNFKDQNFYNCIVDTYNNKNNTQLSYTTNLTDEQLKSITYLDCNSQKILDVSGLEKLPLLTELNLSWNDISDIDLSQNTVLTDLNLNHNNISNIDLSKNTTIIKLSMTSNHISDVDLSQNIALTDLNLNYNNISNIALSSNIINLSLFENDIHSIDLSKNILLTYLSLTNNNIDNIVLNNNTKLTDLYLGYNNISNIDLSQNTLLTKLNLGNNRISNIDLSQNTLLKNLYIYQNPYINNIGIYVNEDVKLLSSVQLPSNKKETITNVINNNENIVINDNLIKGKEIGEYQISVDYTHDVQSSSNDYSMQYNVYVIQATSDKYKINVEEGYIYTYLDTNKDLILSNININYGTKEIIDNKLVIKYNDKIVKEFDIVSISSDTYDLTKEYIYTGTKSFDKTKVTSTNGEVVLENNVLKIKYKDNVLKEYDIVSISSDIYTLIDGYIYTGTKELDKTKVISTNGEVVLENNILKLKYNDVELESFNITGINFGKLQVGNKNIHLLEDVKYADFVSNITTNGVSYKIFNGEQEITSGNITKGMTLKVYISNKLVDTFNITDEYVDLSLLKTDDDNKYILGMNIGDKVSDIISKVSTSGEVSIIDKEEELKTTDNLKTGTKLKIELSKEVYYYEIIVIGDVNGDGKMNVSDIVKINNHIVDATKKLDTIYRLAGDYNGDNKINIQDIVKINNVIVGGN